MSNLLLSKIFPGNNASVNSSCTHRPPPHPPGYCVAFARLVSPGGGGWAIWHACNFLFRLTTQRILLEKQAHWLICQGPEKLKRVLKVCSRFHACFFPRHIKSESHGEIGSYQDVNQRFLDKLKLNQISVDIIWRKFFHIYKTIRIATRQVSTKRLVLYFNDFRIKQVRY